MALREGMPGREPVLTKVPSWGCNIRHHLLCLIVQDNKDTKQFPVAKKQERPSVYRWTAGSSPGWTPLSLDRSAAVTLATAWRDLKDAVLSERRQTQRTQRGLRGQETPRLGDSRGWKWTGVWGRVPAHGDEDSSLNKIFFHHHRLSQATSPARVCFHFHTVSC